MTREEKELALYCLKASSDYHLEVCEECIKYPNCDHTGQDDVTETIIKALEQEPCEDVISRQAVMDCFKKWQPYMATRLWCFEQELSKLPSVNPKEPKTGHWIRKPLKYASTFCSECDYELLTIYENFCPHCGADMRGDAESEEKT